MIKPLQYLNSINIDAKTVVCRVDFNVPFDTKGNISNTARVEAALPTLNYLLEHKCKIILLSHLGRVKTAADCAKNTLKPVAEYLQTVIKAPVTFVPTYQGDEVKMAIDNAADCSIILLENTRFADIDGKKESNCDDELARYWASLGDVFINDAFATAHRCHASNYGISKHMNVKAAGFLMEREVNALRKLIDHPDHPFYVILGGAKIQDKVTVIDSLAPIADKLLIGGAMSYAFLAAQGFQTGTSLLDKEAVQIARQLLSKYPDKLVLPIDHAISKTFANTEPINTHSVNIDDGYMALDIGAATRLNYKKLITDGATIFWNGPLGVYEFANYRIGTLELCQELAAMKNTYTVIGGGDSVVAATDLNLINEFSYVSTGGGASLYFLSQKDMPTLTILEK